jgi:PAS domain S-box-containing protein
MSARILVVEDDRVVLRDLQQQLRRLGHAVVGTAVSGEEALRIAKAERPDLVLMDIRLEGEMDGIDAATTIRDEWYIPVVFFTAYADGDTVRRATRAEPFGYLLKPFEDLQLSTVIEVALYKHAADTRVRQSERRYAATLSSIGDAVIATDASAQVTFMNVVAETLTGWEKAAAMGRPLSEVFRIINEESRETVEDPAAKVLRLGKVVGLANHTILISKAGQERPIDDSGSPIVDDAGQIVGTVLVFRDISAQRILEDKLLRAQSEFARVSNLITMGELAASIAHEINQPLMAIVTNAGTSLRYLDEARKAAERVVSDGHRAGEVVRSIRNLTSKSEPAFRSIDFADILAQAAAVLRGELRRNEVTLEITHDRADRPVAGDPVQLQQVVINLMVNAIEALLNVPSSLRRISVGATATLAALRVRVSDTGGGLNVEDVGRLFQPFFTTKAGGMGMGLAISRNIVEAHGGRLWAAEEEGETCFYFTIPWAQGLE